MMGKRIHVSTGTITNDVGSAWERLAKRIQGNEQILVNNDLKKVVCIAISTILFFPS